MASCVCALANLVCLVPRSHHTYINKYLVHERSILSIKRKALRRTKTLRRDPETNEIIQPSKLSKLLAKLKKPFTKHFWEDVFEKTDNETLIDWKVLSYSYIEAGLIESAAS